MHKLTLFYTKTHHIVFVFSIALATALISEIKIVPFGDESFRFGLGSIVFFFSILIFQRHIVLTGVVTAITIVSFRTALDLIEQFQPFLHPFLTHIPAAIFYIIFAIGLNKLPFQKLRLQPLQLGFYVSILEVVANLMEQLTIILLSADEAIAFSEIVLLVIVAFLRSYFVVAIFSSIVLAEQQKQTERLLSIGADLYVESLYLKKMNGQIEQITADCFQLYKQLKLSNQHLSQQALNISQEIHEIKKDSERILAGLSNIVTDKGDKYYLLDDLLQLAIETNKRYSEWLQKTISISISNHLSVPIHEPFLLLAICNNILANAVEAIETTGAITIDLQIIDELLHLSIANNGPTIAANALNIIFEPGYTTKFNEAGQASTGIGLAHVKTMCERLDGKIEVTSEQWTVFTITIPTNKL